ncbi:MAG: hypothetical protein QM538_07570 [Methylacidiphilales bacterium]|nr:hypothetical protein [Candidatus Methylacidiphilales bacterium]
MALNKRTLLTRGFAGYRITTLLPWHSTLGLFFFVLVLVVSYWVVYQIGLVRGEPQLKATRDQLANTERKLQQQIEAKLTLDKKFLNEIQQNTVLKESNKQLLNLTNDLQNQLTTITPELNYLRGLITNTDQTSGLSIQDFMIDPALTADKEMAYRYQLVVRLIWSGQEIATGSLQVTFVGKSQDKNLVYTIKQLDVNANTSLKIRYFQKFDGLFMLPPGFNVEKVIIEITTNKKQLAPVYREYQWNTLVPSINK